MAMVTPDDLSNESVGGDGHGHGDNDNDYEEKDARSQRGEVYTLTRRGTNPKTIIVTKRRI